MSIREHLTRLLGYPSGTNLPTLDGDEVTLENVAGLEVESLAATDLTTTNLPTTETGGWRDEKSEFVPKETGAGRPTLAAVGGGVISWYHFALNDLSWQTYHLQHDYKPGTAVYFHLHWVPDGTNVNSVKWQFTWSAAKGHQQSAFTDIVTGNVVTVEQSPSGTIYCHHIAEIAAPGISSVEFEPDSLIALQIKRITNGATDNTDKIFVPFIDLHYQVDRFATINKAPNFYV